MAAATTGVDDRVALAGGGRGGRGFVGGGVGRGKGSKFSAISLASINVLDNMRSGAIEVGGIYVRPHAR